jgi:hypothetical protein
LVVEIDDAAYECEVSRTGLECAQVSFFVIERGLWCAVSKLAVSSGMSWLTVHGLAVAPAGVRAACTSSAVKPSLFLVGEDEKYDCIDDEAGILYVVCEVKERRECKVSKC